MTNEVELRSIEDAVKLLDEWIAHARELEFALWLRTIERDEAEARFASQVQHTINTLDPDRI